MDNPNARGIFWGRGRGGRMNKEKIIIVCPNCFKGFEIDKDFFTFDSPQTKPCSDSADGYGADRSRDRKDKTADTHSPQMRTLQNSASARTSGDTFKKEVGEDAI